MFEYNFELRSKRTTDPIIGSGIVECKSMFAIKPASKDSAIVLVPYEWVVDGTVKDLQENAA